MRPSFFTIDRIGVRPDEDDPVAAVPRRRGQRRPHGDATVAKVRRLIEDSRLTYKEIARRTGVSHASICRWAAGGGWVRPLGAPRRTDALPIGRASVRLKGRLLRVRLAALAERCVRELEEAPRVDLDALERALELAKLAKLAAQRPPRGPRRLDAAAARRARRAAEDAAGAGTRLLIPVEELRAAGIDVARLPSEAVAELTAPRVLPEDDPALRPRGRWSRRNREHRAMLERE